MISLVATVGNVHQRVVLCARQGNNLKVVQTVTIKHELETMSCSTDRTYVQSEVQV